MASEKKRKLVHLILLLPNISVIRFALKSGVMLGRIPTM